MKSSQAPHLLVHNARALRETMFYFIFISLQKVLYLLTLAYMLKKGLSVGFKFGIITLVS